MSLYQSTHPISAVPQANRYETFSNRYPILSVGDEDSATHPDLATNSTFSDDFNEWLSTLDDPPQGSQGTPGAPYSHDASSAFMAPQPYASGSSSNSRGQPEDLRATQAVPTGYTSLQLPSQSLPPPYQPDVSTFPPHNLSQGSQGTPGAPYFHDASSAFMAPQPYASGSSSNSRGQPEDLRATQAVPTGYTSLQLPSQSLPPPYQPDVSTFPPHNLSQGSQGTPGPSSHEDACSASMTPEPRASGSSSKARGQPGDVRASHGVPTEESFTRQPPSQPFPATNFLDWLDNSMYKFDGPQSMHGLPADGANASSALPVLQPCASGSLSETRGQPKYYLAQNVPPEFDFTSSNVLHSLSPLPTDSASTHHQYMAAGSTPRVLGSPLAGSSHYNQTSEQDGLADRNDQSTFSSAQSPVPGNRKGGKKGRSRDEKNAVLAQRQTAYRAKESYEYQAVRKYLRLALGKSVSRAKVLEIAYERIQAAINEKKHLTEGNEYLQRKRDYYLRILREHRRRYVEQGIAPIDPTAQHIPSHAQENRGAGPVLTPRSQDRRMAPY
ncbi:hypothetical protein FA95DRAFT_1575226 [Auriscalpium vulgare]|uniref:Uncharacterized protein n=1 Tax=Auriscalpium vulgare TaxID=40419 RepID=A0ACB8RGK3_9AGAM|nr:hypothetical protein FA95DRAFT_1575226 [Auriscalpium vulgare]